MGSLDVVRASLVTGGGFCFVDPQHLADLLEDLGVLELQEELEEVLQGREGFFALVFLAVVVFQRGSLLVAELLFLFLNLTDLF